MNNQHVLLDFVLWAYSQPASIEVFERAKETLAHLNLHDSIPSEAHRACM